jgi:hypothetical protein
LREFFVDSHWARGPLGRVSIGRVLESSWGYGDGGLAEPAVPLPGLKTWVASAPPTFVEFNREGWANRSDGLRAEKGGTTDRLRDAVADSSILVGRTCT